MRLINTQTLEFAWFVGDAVPPYMILSHTWGDDEIDYKEYKTWLKARAADPTHPEPDKQGFRKIKNFCQICSDDYLTFDRRLIENASVFSTEPSITGIRKDYRLVPSTAMEWTSARQTRLHAVANPVQWAWIDTCCIDKRSSAELSEAINSMYQWYQIATICIAYLQDVEAGDADDAQSLVTRVKGSRWITRGWTLQELLAPPQVQFFDKRWTPFWSRQLDASKLANITTIDSEYLKEDPASSPFVFSDYCRQWRIKAALVAVKFSWAARRTTTGIEDRAYSLMGLLNVNMSLLYGEGGRSFVRLQEGIIKRSVDHSLLIWRGWSGRRWSISRAGNLDVFAHVSELPSTLQVYYRAKRQVWEKTVHGLKLTVPLVKMRGGPPLCKLVAVLDLLTTDGEFAIGIWVDYMHNNNLAVYSRVAEDRIVLVPTKSLRNIFGRYKTAKDIRFLCLRNISNSRRQVTLADRRNGYHEVELGSGEHKRVQCIHITTKQIYTAYVHPQQAARRGEEDF